MRTDLTPFQEARIAGTHIQPKLLVKLTLDKTYFLSTRETLLWDGETWQKGLLQLGAIRTDGAVLKFWNPDHIHDIPILRGAYQRSAVKIYWANGVGDYDPYFEPGYMEDGYITGDPLGNAILILDGMINAFSEINEWITIQVSINPPKMYPTTRLFPPLVNHISPPGTILTFGGETYRVESR